MSQLVPSIIGVKSSEKYEQCFIGPIYTDNSYKVVPITLSKHLIVEGVMTAQTNLVMDYGTTNTLVGSLLSLNHFKLVKSAILPVKLECINYVLVIKNFQTGFKVKTAKKDSVVIFDIPIPEDLLLYKATILSKVNNKLKIINCTKIKIVEKYV